MRVVCWIGDSPNHWALVQKLAAEFEIVGIVIDRKKRSSNKFSFQNIIEKGLDKTIFRSINNAWYKLQIYYKNNFPDRAGFNCFYDDSINTKNAFDFTQKCQPDLILVSGTSIVKSPMIDIPARFGIVNLHTGLSPYIKGGPNCTNWCISNNQWGLVGNTIMWLSKGIDSGNIIASEHVDVINEKYLYGIHFKVMESAHDLYLRTVRYIGKGGFSHLSVPQSSLGKGSLYLNRMWTWRKKLQLLINIKSKRELGTSGDVITISLPTSGNTMNLPS